MLTNADIQAEIQRRVAERTMTANEVLIRLAEQGRAAYSQYIDGTGAVDLARLIADGKAHLIKGIKRTRNGDNIEFYDAHEARVLIGTHLGLFGRSRTLEEPEHVVQWTVEEWRAEIERRRQQASETMGMFDGDK